MTQGNTRTIHVTEAIGKGVTYDLIGKLVTATGLTRKTIVEILKGIKPATFQLFKMNPEEFITRAGLIINDCKALAVIQCIRYEKLNDKFSTDIFTENMLRGKLGINAIKSTKSLYDLVVHSKLKSILQDGVICSHPIFSLPTALPISLSSLILASISRIFR